MDKVQDSKWYMAGTQRTGEYLVIAASNLGRIGVRRIGGNVRVRIEPTNATAAATLGQRFTAEGGWKQPDYDQNRFSQIVPADESGISTVVGAIKALGNKNDGLVRNLAARYWRRLKFAAAA